MKVEDLELHKQVSWTDDELKVFANKDVIYPTITFNETEGYMKQARR